MTGPDIPRALERIGWSRRELARRTGYDESTIRIWASGRYDAPAEVMAWLDKIASYHAANPPPRVQVGQP